LKKRQVSKIYKTKGTPMPAWKNNE
jgi:hypothetical protein